MKVKQAMITLQGMAEYRFGIVFNYKCFTLLMFHIIFVDMGGVGFGSRLQC